MFAKSHFLYKKESVRHLKVKQDFASDITFVYDICLYFTKNAPSLTLAQLPK